MAAKKKDVTNGSEENVDITSDLISALNKEFENRIAYDLSSGDSPTHVKRWISTGSKLLDYIISNRKNGGVPEGRIIELYGEPSTGKSHLAMSMAVTVQKMGGLVVLLDAENATMPEKLIHMGVDITKRFIYCDPASTEDVFKITESVIKKSEALVKKNIPILIIWDSVAASSPQAELLGDYDDNTMGLQARVIGKAMRKITGVIGQNNIIFLCLNQTRMKMGVSFGDPTCVDPFTTKVKIRYRLK